jgi:hypothetical protein
VLSRPGPAAVDKGVSVGGAASRSLAHRGIPPRDHDKSGVLTPHLDMKVAESVKIALLGAGQYRLRLRHGAKASTWTSARGLR